MDRRQARETLGLPPLYTAEDVEVAYRDRARTAHPDTGGTHEQFVVLMESRRILLAVPSQQGRVVAKDDRPLRRLARRLRHPRMRRPRGNRRRVV